MILDKIVKINEIAIKIRLSEGERPDGILAFVELRLLYETGDTFEKIRGITIKNRDFDRGNATIVDFPAFRGRGKFYKSVFFEDRSFYFKISEEILKKYGESVSDSIKIPF